MELPVKIAVLALAGALAVHGMCLVSMVERVVALEAEVKQLKEAACPSLPR